MRSSRLQAAGRADEALPALERSLWLSRRVVGEDHPEVAVSYAAMGEAHEDLGHDNQARALYLKAREIFSVPWAGARCQSGIFDHRWKGRAYTLR